MYRTGLNYTFSPEPPPVPPSCPSEKDSPQLQAMGNMNGYDKPTENGSLEAMLLRKLKRHRPPPLLVLPNQNGAVSNRHDYTPAVCSIEQLTPNSPLLTDSSTTSPPPRILSPPKMQEQQSMPSHIIKQPSSVATCWNGSFPGVSMSHTYPGDCRIIQTTNVPPQLVPIKQQEEAFMQQYQMRAGQVSNIRMPPQLVPIPQQTAYHQHHVANSNSVTGIIPTVSLAMLQQATFPHTST